METELSPLRVHQTILGISTVAAVLVLWGVFDSLTHIIIQPDRLDMALIGAALLLAMLYFLPALLSPTETYNDLHHNSLLWSHPVLPVYVGLGLAMVYPILSGRFGMAFVGMISAAAIGYGCILRLRLLAKERGQRLDATLDHLSDLVRRREADESL